MGQYYRPLLIRKGESDKSAYSHDFNNGLKLMEHSWIGNSFVNAVLHEIEDKPTRVAWLGDYSDSAIQDGCDLGGGFITNVEGFLEKYQSVWGGQGTVVDIRPDTPKFKLDMEHTECYLVNWTKQCYIDLDEYVKRNSQLNKFGLSETWCINPLPLLTCVGNGMGGGDYRGKTGISDVGLWSFDEICVTYLRPGKLKKVMYCFQE